jgi:D-alanine-D-alanine ligase
LKVLLLHDRLAPSARPDEEDARVQAEAVSAALDELGHGSERLEADLDLSLLARELERRSPDVVFNLVESLGGAGRLIHLVPGLLDHLGIPYTGAPAESLMLTSNKLLAKRWMDQAGVPTPPWRQPDEDEEPLEPGRYIVKSVWEHASLGLDEASVVELQSQAELARAVERRRSALGGSAFAERYVEGREFSLSLLAGGFAPEVLPAAEILFEGFPEGGPRVVGYRAKWQPESAEYRGTVRRFGFSEAEAPLLEELEALARRLWVLFDLHGWARVDFRVDEEGRPWVLEVNANPCLAPDAGFAAALERAGHEQVVAIERILTDIGSAHRLGG